MFRSTPLRSCQRPAPSQIAARRTSLRSGLKARMQLVCFASARHGVAVEVVRVLAMAVLLLWQRRLVLSLSGQGAAVTLLLLKTRLLQAKLAFLPAAFNMKQQHTNTQ